MAPQAKPGPFLKLLKSLKPGLGIHGLCLGLRPGPAPWPGIGLRPGPRLGPG